MDCKSVSIDARKKTDRAIITQSELAEMVRLREEDERRQQLRRKLIDLLEHGAEIEPGPLMARILKQSQQRISSAKLAMLLGAERVAQLTRDVEPTFVKMVRINEAKKHRKPKRPRDQ